MPSPSISSVYSSRSLLPRGCATLQRVHASVLPATRCVGFYTFENHKRRLFSLNQIQIRLERFTVRSGFKLYEPGAYAPGFGLIPPRLGLWARPLDGFDFSISTERGVVPIRGCPSPSSEMEKVGQSVDFAARNGANL